MTDTEPLQNTYAVNLLDPAARYAVAQRALKRRTQRNVLLDVFASAGEPGATYEEAADVVGWVNTRKCWWKRCSDLREDGWIERHGTPQVRRGTQGTECAVYVISPAGLAALVALDTPNAGSK